MSNPFKAYRESKVVPQGSNLVEQNRLTGDLDDLVVPDFSKTNSVPEPEYFLDPPKNVDIKPEIVPENSTPTTPQPLSSNPFRQSVMAKSLPTTPVRASWDESSPQFLVEQPVHQPVINTPHPVPPVPSTQSPPPIPDSSSPQTYPEGTLESPRRTYGFRRVETDPNNQANPNDGPLRSSSSRATLGKRIGNKNEEGEPNNLVDSDDTHSGKHKFPKPFIKKKEEDTPEGKRGVEALKTSQLLGRISSKAKLPLLQKDRVAALPERKQDADLHIQFAAEPDTKESVFVFEPLVIPETNFDVTEIGPGHFSVQIYATVPLVLSNSDVLGYLMHVYFPRGGSKIILRQYTEFRDFHDSLMGAKLFSKPPRIPKLPANVNTNSTTLLCQQAAAQLQHYLSLIFYSKPDLQDVELEKQYFFSSFLGLDDRGATAVGSFATARGFIEQKCTAMMPTILQIEEILNNFTNINLFFSTVTSITDWQKASSVAQIVIAINHALEKKPAEGKFVPIAIPKASRDQLTDPELLKFRELMFSGLSELSSKVRALLTTLLLSRLSDPEIDAIKGVLKEILDKFTSPLIAPLAGWLQESGTSDYSLQRWPSYLRENCPWYNDFYFNNPHINVVCIDPTNENPYVVSLISSHHHGIEYVRGIGRCRDGFKKVISVAAPENSYDKWDKNPNIIKNIIHDMYPGTKSIAGLEFCLSNTEDFELELLKMEPKDMKVTPKFKFAVLYCAPGQTIEEDMFSNEFGSDSFNYFLELIGDRVTLSGFNRFNGGLDIRGDNTTGTESVFTTFKGYDIMYHVATLLPFSGQNTQQLHKKRHLGNDIVMIVFQDYGSEPYVPNCVKSQFIQIIIVVRPVTPTPAGEKPGQSPVFYHVSVVHQAELPAFGPPLPMPAIFEHAPYFRSWLLTKMVNGELGAYRSAVFNQRHRDAYKGIAQDLVVKYTSVEKKKPLGASKITARVGGLVQKWTNK